MVAGSCPDHTRSQAPREDGQFGHLDKDFGEAEMTAARIAASNEEDKEQEEDADFRRLNGWSRICCFIRIEPLNLWKSASYFFILQPLRRLVEPRLLIESDPFAVVVNVPFGVFAAEEPEEGWVDEKVEQR